MANMVVAIKLKDLSVSGIAIKTAVFSVCHFSISIESRAVSFLTASWSKDEKTVEGKTELPSEKKVLTDYLIKDGRTNISVVGKQSDHNAKKAVLSYQIQKIEKTKSRSNESETAINAIALLKIELETGRHHQIRVQLANAGMPLLGDLKYGSQLSKSLSQELGIRDVALCAHRLLFLHPKLLFLLQAFVL